MSQTDQLGQIHYSTRKLEIFSLIQWNEKQLNILNLCIKEFKYEITQDFMFYCLVFY